MSWLEKGISSLKGQITNFTKEVLSEDDPDSAAAASAAPTVPGDAPAPGPGPGPAQDPANQATATTRGPAKGPASLEAHSDPGADSPAGPDRHHHEQAEGFFGQASAALSGLPLPLFGRSSSPQPSPDERVQLRQHCHHLESTVQRLLQQLEEVSEARDKEALELATLRRELRLRGHGDSSGSGSGPGSGSGSGHSDSPQLPDEGGAQQSPDGTGISPALSDDGFTKLDPSETELWEATQELSHSLETQVELHKRELEKYQQMKQEWTVEKAALEKNVNQLQKQLHALQDWQSPDIDFENGNVVELNSTLSKLQKENEILQKENEILQKEKIEAFENLRIMESKLINSEKDRAELAANMEELDSQNQDTLNQFLQIKKELQVKHDALKIENEKLLSSLEELKKERDNLQLSAKENENLLEELSSLQLECLSLEKENEELKGKCKYLECAQVETLAREKEELLSKLLASQEENSSLTKKIESIQSDLAPVESLTSENETLKTKLEALQCKFESVKSDLSDRLKDDEHCYSEQSCPDVTSTERYIIEKLKNIVSLDIPVEYYKGIAERESGSEKELEDQLDMVAALVKMAVDLRWKNETLERNLLEYSRQHSDLSAQLSGRDKQVMELEEECVVLRENIESLLDGLNVTPEKGMLPSIPETSEAGEDEFQDGSHSLEDLNSQGTSVRVEKGDEKDLNTTISNLEREVEILREARSSLEDETKRLRSEVHDLASRLRSSQSMLRDQDNLKGDLSQLREQARDLQRRLSDLQRENAQLKEEVEMARFGQDSLQAEVSEWKTLADTASQERNDAIRAKELLASEVAEVRANLAALSSTHDQLNEALQAKNSLKAEITQLQESVKALTESNKSLTDANAAMGELKEEVARLKQELEAAKEAAPNAKVDETAELLHKIDTLDAQKRQLELSLSEVTSENAGLCEHIMNLQQKCDTLSADLACKASSEYDNTQNFLHEKQALEEQVAQVTQQYESGKKVLDEVNSLKSSMQSELEQLQQRLQDTLEENQRYERSLQQRSQNEISLNEQLEAMSAAKHASEQEVKNLQEQLEKLQCSPLKDGDTAAMVESLERKLNSMLEEKEQILSVLNDKTRENSVLRSENQKLLTAISENHPSDQSVKLMQQLNQLQQERDELISTVQIKHNESLNYHAEILRLRALLDQKMQTEISFQPNPKDKNEVLSITDAPSKSPELSALEEKCASLASSLQQEKTQNTYLQNEMQEQHEKEAIMTRELERLRAHLVEVEENYTTEALRLEELVHDLQGKLNAAEERLRSVSTAHTSASILANQHVESLQGQSRLIGQQRDELQSKLSAAEDREQKNAAALRNLQAVLEQFQRDKERDLASMTEKLRLELQIAHKKHDEYCVEIRQLKDQLTEAKEGLSAASRLSAQLDKKSETINALKEQIAQQQRELKGAEERIRSASQSVEGKVDKSLVKNLVVGLLTAPSNSRSPALRVVASVLDFNLDERQKVGLEQSPAHNEQSLSEAFVRFLESESRPQMQLRLLPEASHKPHQEGRKDSHGSSVSSDSPARRSPVLSEVVLPTLAPLPVGRSSSSILKDVLKNDV